MRITLEWLRELVPLDGSLADLTGALVRAGVEVESVEDRRPVWGPVEIAAVVDVQRHPNADRLRLCEIRRAGGVVKVVCGASNMRPGDLVALAVPGTVMPDGRRIERSAIRGETSEGMLCSAEELGMEKDGSEGILILPPDAPVGMPLVDYLRANDVVLDLGLTPNRGDCLSVLGIAREVAAATGASVSLPPAPVDAAGTTAGLRVTVEAPDLCPRYCARIVRGVRIGPSPGWLRTRLAMVGLRSINNVVDATNYVMIERGQPLHAFDLARIRGRSIVVRRAGKPGSYTTLDGNVHELVADDLVIADAYGPVALAGIMGGADSEIRDGTVDVLLEGAFFQPESVRRTARRLLVTTDSSYRFERGVDPGGTRAALERLTAMLVGMAGGIPGPVVEKRVRGCGVRKAIRLRPARLDALLGVHVERAAIEKALRALGAEVAGSGAMLRVVPPSHRFDLLEEVDLVEEVARLTGYDAIPESLPSIVVRDVPGSTLPRLLARVREVVRTAGFSEMVTLAMVARDDNAIFRGHDDLPDGTVSLRNPPSAEGAELRRSLVPGLLRALDRNLRQGEPHVAAFTLGRVYAEGAGEFTEVETLGLVAAGIATPPSLGESARAVGFGDVKGVIDAVLGELRATACRWEASTIPYLHPGKQARLLVDGVAVAIAGALHPDEQARRGLDLEVWVAELDLQKVVRYFPPRITFQPLPRFPAIQRDLAVVVEGSFQAQQVLDVIHEASEPLVEEVRVFDHYTGPPIPEGKKSLAYAVSYRAPERTLTDEEVNRLHETIVERVVRRLGVEVRR